MPIAAVGLGVGLVSGIAGLFHSGSANRKLEQLLKQDPAYSANPIAAQRMGLAQTLLNSRMPGAASLERNIYGSQANTNAGIERNATDSSQALALMSGGQGQTNKAFGDLATQEDQDYQRRYGNLVGAQQGEIQEGDKVYQDQIRRFQDMAQIRGQQNQNTSNAWSSLGNMGFGLANFGLSGGTKALGLGNGTQNNQQGGGYYGSTSQTNPYGTGGPVTF
jgi:hypothetical protein